MLCMHVSLCNYYTQHSTADTQAYALPQALGVDHTNMADEAEILHEAGIKAPPRAKLDVHKNPLLISILDGVDSLKQMAERKEIPPIYLQHAKGLLFMKTDKIGFGLSITQGYGLVLAKAPNRPSGWSAPLPVKVDGFSIGAVMGFSEQHTVIAMATDEQLDSFKQDKRAMKIGLDLALNLTLRGEDLVNKDLALDTAQVTTGQSGLKTRAFTFSKGVMVDMSLKGTSVEPDMEDIVNCYGKEVTPSDILTGTVAPPREAILLYNTIKEILDANKGLLSDTRATSA